MRRSIVILGIGLLLLTGGLFLFLELGGLERTYEVKGRVAGLSGGDQALFVEHDSVPGYRGAATSRFEAEDSVPLADVSIGDAVQMQVTFGWGNARITDITQLPDNAVPMNPAATKTSTEDSSGRSAAVEVGEPVPDVTLIDHNGEKLRLSDYRGQTLVLTFIYTNCPLPDFCPLMSQQFAALQPKFNEAFGNRAQLLSISFDPENDTPEVLTDYAKKHTDDLSTWTFATGKTPAELEKAKEMFRITTMEKKGEIVHNLVTALIGPGGRLVWLWRGNDWTPEDIFQVAKQTLVEEKLSSSH